MPGHCFFGTNVKSKIGIWTTLVSFVVGLDIIFLFLAPLNYVNESMECIYIYIYGAIIAVMIYGLLFFWVHAHNNTRSLVWIVLAVIECVNLCLIAVLLAIGMVYVGVTNPIFVILFTFNIAATVFAIWEIVLTKKARKEIIEGQEQEKEG